MPLSIPASSEVVNLINNEKEIERERERERERENEDGREKRNLIWNREMYYSQRKKNVLSTLFNNVFFKLI